MFVENFYKEINGDYENTLKRFGSKELLNTFIIKFSQDNTLENLCDFYNNNDIENAFLSAHTLKGICANLGFSKLYEVSSILTEILRKRSFDNSKEAYEKVLKEYKKTIEALNNNL